MILRPCVSIVIPMFNSATTVEQTVRSVLGQTLPDWNAVIVDDGSTDAGAGERAVRSTAADDSRISFFRQANRGLAGARNAGLDWLTANGSLGRHVLFLDADDWLLPSGLEALVAAAEQAGTSAYGAFEVRNADGELLGLEEPAVPMLGINELLELHFVVTHCLLIRSSDLHGVRFDETARRVEDYDMWFRLAQRGVRWAAAHQPVCAYRVGRSSMSTDCGAMLHWAQLAVRSAFEGARAANLPGVDACEARQRTKLGQIALNWATRAAMLGGPESIDSAAQWWKNAEGDKHADADRLAGSAVGAVLVGLGQRPRLDGKAERVWVDTLQRWCERLERDGYAPIADPGHTTLWERTARSLAERLVEPNEVDAAVVRKAMQSGGAARGVTMLGLGRNGRRLARLLAARGVPVRVQDERLADGVLPVSEQAPGLVAEPFGTPVDHRSVLIVSPADDAALLSRAPISNHPPRSVVRWGAVRRHMADKNRSLLLGGVEAAAA